MVIPIFDLVSTAWPMQPRTLQWRYGFLGLLANVMLTPLLGAVLASFVAATLEKPQVLQGLSGLYLVGALLLGGAVVLFGLDVLQLQREVAQQQITNYRAGAAIAGVKYVLAMAALGWLGLAGFKTARALRERGGRRSDRD